MSKNKNIQDPEIKVEEALSKTEKIFETYKTKMLIAAIALIVIAGGIYAYHNLITLPKQQEAMGQMFPAEQLFEDNNFEEALNGNGNVLGFKQIINEYGTKAGVAVYLYAGVCELQLGNYSSALEYLKSYKGEDPIMNARAIACMGDAYAGLGDLNKAVAEYNKAVSADNSIFAAGYLLKAGIIYEELGNKQEALKAYESIKQNYPRSPEGVEIDKYISRIKVELK